MEKIEIKCTEEILDIICRAIIDDCAEYDIKNVFGIDLTDILGFEDRVEALKQCFDRKEPPRWRAEKDELYYQVNDLGCVIPTTDWHNSTDDKLYNSGNYFKTAEEA